MKTSIRIYMILLISILSSRVFADALPQVYFRAAETGWQKQAMLSGYGGDIYSYDHLVTFKGAGPHKFKFDVYGDWSYNFGRDPNSAPVLTTDNQMSVPFINGEDIEVQEPGTYEVVFTDGGGSGSRNWSYRIRRLSELKLESRWQQVYFRGSSNGWINTAMTLIDHHKWKISVTFANEPNQSFKFDQSGEWLGGMGDINVAGKVGFLGEPIAVKPGSYDIILDDRTFEYQVTAKVQAEDWRRTLIFIKAPTTNGQAVFLRGGIDHQYAAAVLGYQCSASNKLCGLPIRHQALVTDKNRAADQFLDWYGAEDGQDGDIQGSPLIWTTNNPNYPQRINTDGYGYSPFNSWGEQYWMLDVMMDCSKTVNGWFEFKSYVSNGKGWEGNVSQQGVPYISGNHFAQCGMLNRFERGSSKAAISWLP